MKTKKGSVTVTLRDFVELEITYINKYENDSLGSLENTPSESTSILEITNITKDGKDYTPILDRFKKMYPNVDIMKEIEDEIYDKTWDFA
jgi:hypothetical protein